MDHTQTQTSRRYSRMLFFMVIVFLFSCAEKEQEKPNIIFLLTDDHRWDALGAMGNPIIQTPNIDNLAKEGVMYRNAYVTTAICMVSRVNMLTGQYLARHGINDFGVSLEPEALQNTYPLLLKQAGYEIGFIGKFGVGRPKEQPAEHFDFWACSPTGQPHYDMTDEHGRYLHHTDKVGQDINRFLSQRNEEKPFCLSVSFKAPHVQDNDPRNFIIHPRYESYYSDVTIPVPETADPKYWEQFPDFFRTDQNIARERWKPRLSTPELYQHNVKNYYRLLTHVDDIVGNVVEKLKELDLDENTVIIFTGDNGMYLGEHGLTGKWYGHEESIRVPLVIYDPRKEQASRGKVCDEIALNVDIAPTILTFAGVEVPDRMQGIDLVTLVENPDEEAVRQDFFYEHTFLGSPRLPKVQGLVSRDWKYMQFIEHGYEEVYDLKSDPLEKNNLADDPAYQDKISKLKTRFQELKEKAK